MRQKSSTVFLCPEDKHFKHDDGSFKKRTRVLQKFEKDQILRKKKTKKTKKSKKTKNKIKIEIKKKGKQSKSNQIINYLANLFQLIYLT